MKKTGKEGRERGRETKWKGERGERDGGKWREKKEDGERPRETEGDKGRWREMEGDEVLLWARGPLCPAGHTSPGSVWVLP